jgi:hypothetical protein
MSPNPPSFILHLRQAGYHPRSDKHSNALVDHCIHQMRGIASRSGLVGEGLEAKAVIVVDMDNQDLPSTRFVTTPPAPPIGDPLHYDAFTQKVAALYLQRFA